MPNFKLKKRFLNFNHSLMINLTRLFPTLLLLGSFFKNPKPMAGTVAIPTKVPFGV